jgi:RHS repeat-associated protein
VDATASALSDSSYLLSDHQAGVASITNSSGAQVIGESFTAFGNRRNPTTWSGPAANSDLTTIAGITREGYTFQTALGLWMGLNHMNGRVQDAVTGRFLSADPHIPHRRNTQSYNRYSYVNNNPLSYIDPSGFDGCPPDAAGCTYNAVYTSTSTNGVDFQLSPNSGYQFDVSAIQAAGTQTPGGLSPNAPPGTVNVGAEFAAVQSAIVPSGSGAGSITLNTDTGLSTFSTSNPNALGPPPPPIQPLTESQLQPITVETPPPIDLANPAPGPAPGSETSPAPTPEAPPPEASPAPTPEAPPPEASPAPPSVETPSPPPPSGCDPGAHGGGCPQSD